MSVDDFIELGEAYFWFLDIIDPFTGMFCLPHKTVICHFSGGVFETPVPGGEVGPTNGRIIGNMFERLKYGDRFFFNHKSSNNARGLGPVALKNVMRYKLKFV